MLNLESGYYRIKIQSAYQNEAGVFDTYWTIGCWSRTTGKFLIPGDTTRYGFYDPKILEIDQTRINAIPEGVEI